MRGAMLLKTYVAAILLSVFAAAAPQCAIYSPKTCVIGESVEIGNKHCHPQECDFNVEETFKCGFPESGEYTYTDPPAKGCEDPFMTTHRGGPSPCGERCCRPDHEGDFTEDGTVPGFNATRYIFQPTDNDCRFDEISRGQILHYLNSRAAPLLVIGDSMMRQFFLRLVMMMRGQQRLLDYHLHTHAQYSVCKEADVFRIATNSANLTAGAPNNEHLKSKIPNFFRMTGGPGKVVGRESLERCSRTPAEFHYIHSPRWRTQYEMLPFYMNYLPGGVKPVILTSVGYWEGSERILPEYMETITALRGKVLKVFVVSIPTVRVPTEERKATLRKRNDVMRQWVADQGEPYVYLDFDAISLAPHSPPGGSQNNWHYMCSIAWRGTCNECESLMIDHSDGAIIDKSGQRTIVSQIPQATVERVHATDDGLCADELNRNMWQVVFNTLAKPKKEEGKQGRRLAELGRRLSL